MMRASVNRAGWRSGAYRSFLAALPLVLLLTGCWDRREVNDLAVVSAIGLDTDPNSRGIVISAQIFVPTPPSSTIGGAQGGGQMNSNVVVAAPGMDIADASQKLQEKLSRQLFWGHTKIIVFGEKLARRGINDMIDYLGRHPGPRERALVFVSEGKAAEKLGLGPLIESSSSENLREMAILRTGLHVTLLKLERESSRKEAIALPLVKSFETIGKVQTSVFPQGSAILKKGKMVGRIDDSETRGLMWATNAIRNGTLTIHLDKPGEMVSVSLYQCKSELIPSIRGDEWGIRIRASAEGNVVENISSLDMMDEKTILMLEKKFEAAIRKRIQSVLNPLQKQWKADAAGFGQAFHRKYPKPYEQAAADWDERYAQVRVSYDVHLLISRSGFTDKSLSR
ncbi:Ger(x)C family spore germination protein [Paenibacillus sacheonensis]|uniref:Ger(X)C family spore germination protein n=1 Tax=Paenibacillus sacheonensis TaxID=742054 RepID=A0A7X4YPY7_9BACL|nr:Ger(x)C family spore germination protein [Paenibacillus sacheonensis]MBM7564886.1 spore germination protein KC [Paenibacillus sacheonensis]NBC69434.1 Ger(x)C family spore germination protein [Paenibacillus sacheonensis]